MVSPVVHVYLLCLLYIEKEPLFREHKVACVMACLLFQSGGFAFLVSCSLSIHSFVPFFVSSICLLASLAYFSVIFLSPVSAVCISIVKMLQKSILYLFILHYLDRYNLNFFLLGQSRPLFNILSFPHDTDLKADSHQTQQSAFSAVGCVNTEIGNFLSPFRNATVCPRCMWKTQ